MIFVIIYKKYKVKPEFLWDTSPDNGVFRNKYNKKWFGIILNVSKNKLDSNYKQEEVEVINMKLNKIMINELLKEKGFFKAYHMNKKSWISIIFSNNDFYLSLGYICVKRLRVTSNKN